MSRSTLLVVAAAGALALASSACASTKDAARTEGVERDASDREGEAAEERVATIPVDDTDDGADDACDRLRVCMMAVIAQLPPNQRERAKNLWTQMEETLIRSDAQTRQLMCTQATKSYAQLPQKPAECQPEAP